jgi:hypothetical protein
MRPQCKGELTNRNNAKVQIEAMLELIRINIWSAGTHQKKERKNDRYSFNLVSEG